MLSLQVPSRSSFNGFFDEFLSRFYDLTHKYKVYKINHKFLVDLDFYILWNIKNNGTQQLEQDRHLLSDMKFEVTIKNENDKPLVQKLAEHKMDINEIEEILIDGTPTKKLVENYTIFDAIKLMFPKLSFDDIYKEFTLTNSKGEVYFGYKTVTPKINTGNVIIKFKIPKEEYEDIEKGKKFLIKLEELLDTVVHKYE
jgi:hypothetical protein